MKSCKITSWQCMGLEYDNPENCTTEDSSSLQCKFVTPPSLVIKCYHLKICSVNRKRDMI